MPWPMESAAPAEPLLARAEGVTPRVPTFPEVFHAYSPFVWRVLLKLGVPEIDVDDVAQEVFLSVHRKLASFAGRSSLRTWMYTICHRRAVDYHRRSSLRPDRYAGPPPERTMEADQEQDYELTQARARLRGVLDELDHDKRTVFVLFDIEGLDMEEIAELANCPVQTAYARLYAARRKVRSIC